jgi:LysR family transcriptional regulator, transcriptional activator of the cysJI operon
MKKHFPEVIPSVQIGNSREISQALLSHQIDIGIVEGDITNQNLYIKPISTDEMYIIAGINSELQLKKEVTIEQLEKQMWIVREEGSGTREATERLFQTLNMRPTSMIEFGSTQLIKEAVEAGMGITFLSELSVQKEKRLNTVQFLNVKGTPIQRNFSIITESVQLQTKSMKVFIDLIEDYYRTSKSTV